MRWNEDCARVVVEGDARRSTLRCYSVQLQRGLSQLTQQFLGTTLVENYTQPGEYTGIIRTAALYNTCIYVYCITHIYDMCNVLRLSQAKCRNRIAFFFFFFFYMSGELIGLEYLYSQTGAAALQLDVGPRS